MTIMTRKPTPGLFITGTDTDVGKTYVGALIARHLAAAGHRVGVYKPAASGCIEEGGAMISTDAKTLWEAAGCPGALDRVCPQRFRASVAPHLAARAEGRPLDTGLLRSGLDYWRERSDVVLVEGIGGLMCPVEKDVYVADLAFYFGFPLVVVSRNALGTINHTLQTLITAATFREGLKIAGIVLNHPAPPDADSSVTTNRQELTARCFAPVLAEVFWQSNDFDTPVDWMRLAAAATGPTV